MNREIDMHLLEQLPCSLLSYLCMVSVKRTSRKGICTGFCGETLSYIYFMYDLLLSRGI